MEGSLSCGNSMSTTLPSTCVTMPLVRVGAVAVMCCVLCSLGSARAGDNLEDLRGDGRLTGLVVGEREIAQQLARVVGRVLHGDHLGRVEAGNGLEQWLVDQRLDVALDQGTQNRLGVWLEDVLRGRAFFGHILGRL